MKNLLLIFAISFTSCQLAEPDYIYSIDKEIEPYYLEFIYEGNVRGLNLTQVSILMAFDELEDEMLGESVNNIYTSYPKVLIDRSEWLLKSDSDRRYTVYHELGHALLDRRHEENNESIMSSYKSAIRNFATDPAPMINELFE